MPASVYPTGTTVYNPDKCWNGYTLFQTRSLTPGPAGAILVDMNGNTVNLWRGLCGFPVKMLPGGYAMGHSGRPMDRVHPRYIAGSARLDARDLVQVDWDGNVVWAFDQYDKIEVPGGKPVWAARWHHDYQREGNPVGYYVPGTDALTDRGNTLLLCHKNLVNSAISEKPLIDCAIVEVTWDGKIIWEWLCSDHFEEIGFSEEAKNALARNPAMVGEGDGRVGDWVHMNSISYLGPNRWYDAGDERFHPDNIIWDGRQTNHIAIIDKKNGKLVWQVGPDYTATEALRNLGQIVGQHHAHMIPRGLPGEGNILVFDNGGWAGYGAPNPGAPTGNNYARRDHSRILEFDPTTLKIVWQYTPREAGHLPMNAYKFYSPTISGMQRLPNGNTLICEGDAGRLIEVTPEHETVWEYQSPYEEVLGTVKVTWIYRAYRVPYEWVPQVDKPEERAIARIDNSKFRVPGSPRRKAGKVTRVKTQRRSL